MYIHILSDLDRNVAVALSDTKKALLMGAAECKHGDDFDLSVGTAVALLKMRPLDDLDIRFPVRYTRLYKTTDAKLAKVMMWHARYREIMVEKQWRYLIALARAIEDGRPTPALNKGLVLDRVARAMLEDVRGH